MSAPVRDLFLRMLACLGCLNAVLMLTVLFRERHSAIAFLFIATPALFLLGSWFSYRRISHLLDENFSGQQATLTLLRERVAILAMFAIAGIGIAMMMGIAVEKLALH